MYAFEMMNDDLSRNGGREPHGLNALSESGKEVAKHLIANFAADAHERLRYQQQISINTIKSLMTVNGAAIVGLLTFIGNSKKTLDEGDLRSAFLFFAIGLCSSLLSNLGAWATEGNYKDFSDSHSFNYQDLLEGRSMGYIDDSRQELRRGNFWLGATVVVMTLSLIAFCVGSFIAINGIF